MSSPVGAWSRWFAGVKEPAPFGDSPTYAIARDWLAPCATIEDWGCGKGWFKTLRPDVIGVDGTETPFSDVVADLRTYRSDVDGILLRHVLEHNTEWMRVIDNATASARQRLCVVLFTPCAGRTHQIAYADDIGIPDISFNLADLHVYLTDFVVETDHLNTVTQYGVETVLRCERVA